jgi:MoaA/NifB/PqqE/SkfB family radical SAM enzyme
MGLCLTPIWLGYNLIMFDRLRKKRSYRVLKERNLELNSREAASGATRLATLPISLYVDINLKCNLRCPSCHRNHPQHEGHQWPTMPIELFERIASDLFPTAYRVMLTGGGESLVHKDIDRILELCGRYQVYTTIVTNGTTVTPARAALMASAGMFTGISVDGACKETFEKLRYPAKWERFIKSLEALRSAREETGNPAFFPHLQVVVQRDNTAELPDFVDMASGYGFELVKYSNLFAHFDELEARVPDPRLASESFVEVFKRANERGIRIEAPDYGDTPSAAELAALREGNVFHSTFDDSPSAKYVTGGFVKYPDFASLDCRVPWSETMITPEGKVVVGCCSQFQMGDLATEPFRDIWNNESYRRLRETVNTGAPLDFCGRQTCPFRLQVPA